MEAWIENWRGGMPKQKAATPKYCENEPRLDGTMGTGTSQWPPS